MESEGFEVYCGRVLTALGFDCPAYPTGKAEHGFILETRLRSREDRVVRIDVENRGPVTLDSLLTHELWAREQKVDLLLVLAAGQVTSRVVDWIEVTQTERPFPILVWDRDRVDRLGHDLLAPFATDTEREGAVVRVHVSLANEIARHHGVRQSRQYDPRLEVPYSIPALDGRSPFVNREQELARLSKVDAYQLAFLTGPPGIGKSSLGREVLRNGASQGLIPVIVTVRLPGPDPCEHLVINVAKALRHVHAPADLLDMLRQFGVANLENLFDVVISSLQKNRLLVLIENYHLVPERSRIGTLLQEYLHGPGDSRFVITSRHHLPPAWRLGADTLHLSLRGLDEESIQRYFRILQVPAETKLVKELVRRHDGWPIVVSEIGTQLRNAGGRSGRAISLARLTAETIFPAVATQTLSTLSAPGRVLLSFLLGMHVEVSPTELMGISGLDEDGFAEAWSELEKAGVIGTNPELSNSVHDLLRAPLREALVSPKIEEVWGTYLARSGENPDRIAAAVEHFLRIPEVGRAADALLAGADSLLRRGMYTMLLRLSQHFAPAAVSETQYLDLVLRRCKALEGLGRVEEAYDALMTAFPSASNGAPMHLRTRYACVQARLLYHLGRYAEALGIIGGTEESPRTWESDDLQELAQLVELRGRIHYIMRDLDGAEVDYGSAMEIHGLLDNEYGVNKMRHRLAIVAMKRGQYREAEREFKVVERTSRRLGDMKRLSYSLHRLGEIRGELEDYGEARRLLKESLAIKKRMGHLRGLVFSSAQLGRIAIREGALDEAAQHVQRAFELVMKLEMPKEEASVCSLMAAVRLGLGNRAEAENWILRAQRIYRDLGLTARADEATLESIARWLPAG